MASLRQIFIVASVLSGFAVAADPNFSGAWKLNEQRSDIQALRVPAEKELPMEHDGGRIRMGKAPAVRVMTTDGKETRNKFGEVEERSILKWEGDALLVNTIVRSPVSSYTQMDRWKLSRDGRTWSIRRQIVSLHGQTESTLVYEKQ